MGRSRDGQAGRRGPETRADASDDLLADETRIDTGPVSGDDSDDATLYAEPDGEATEYVSPQAPAEPNANGEPDPDATVYGDDDLPPEPPPAASPPAEELDRSVLEPGTVLFGEYEIIDVLGVGGMGEVYRARHRRLDEARAIKVMHPSLVRDPTALEFFEREARALLKVRHPAVVNCHDLLSDQEGRVYLIMEMIDGIALSDRLRNGPLAVEEVRTLARRVASGLAAAHAKGVVHRDLSPDNIVLPGGRPEEAKLIDFGIAKVLAAGQETILDGFKGKLPYASPEQLGFFGGKIDGHSDIYSLGLVLYAAATGHALDMGDSFVDAVDRRRSFTRLPDDLPRALRPDLERLLALEPEQRPVAAGLFADAGRGAASPTWSSWRPSWLVWGGGASAALALAAAAFLALREPAPPAPGPNAEGPAAPGERSVATPSAEPVAVAEQTPPAKRDPQPTPPSPKRISPKDRLRIVGLLGTARAAFAEDQLTSPPGANAYEKYRQVLEIDPRNAEAQRGIERIGARYIALARASMDQGELDKASGFLDKAGRVTPRHPELASARTALREAGVN